MGTHPVCNVFASWLCRQCLEKSRFQRHILGTKLIGREQLKEINTPPPKSQLSHTCITTPQKLTSRLRKKTLTPSTQFAFNLLDMPHLQEILLTNINRFFHLYSDRICAIVAYCALI